MLVTLILNLYLKSLVYDTISLHTSNPKTVGAGPSYPGPLNMSMLLTQQKIHTQKSFLSADLNDSLPQ